LTRRNDPGTRALKREIAAAPDPHIVRIVAMVDAMAARGPADALIAPLRSRLAALRPPRPLRFCRLLFHPLDRLIVPASHWRPDRDSIPRTALAPIAEHVRRAMGPDATAIDGQIANRTTADTDLIARCGAVLWPAAARAVLAGSVPDNWEATGFNRTTYAPLAASIAALLDQGAAMEALAGATANGLLPPDGQRIGAILAAVAAAHLPALPMMIAILLARIPAAAATLPAANTGATGIAVQAALGRAADRMLAELDEQDGTKASIASGNLGDAGAAAGRIATLLRQLDTDTANPQRQVRLRAIRKKLDAGCKARFTAGLEQELLLPLNAPAPPAVTVLETAARGLRVLETEARTVGSGATYDMLLKKAAEAIGGSSMLGRLAPVDQVRLVEILAGPEAAMALLAGVTARWE
jgi:hypothetical protein